MSRLEIIRPGKAETGMRTLYADWTRSNAVAPAGNCPVEQSAAFIRASLAQSCGKCVPCRVGLWQLSALMQRILEGEGTAKDLVVLEELATSIRDSADCAIGAQAAGHLLQQLQAFRADFVSHIEKDLCTAKFAPVPCKAGCPAHVDIPGYIALCAEGRYREAIEVIRYDNPFPAACALICEHPCEAVCRRTLVDAAVNIRGLKRFAVDQAGTVPPPAPQQRTGKRVAVIGGGPSGLTAAYYLQLMGHQVTVFEQREQLGGMMRYGIPRYRLPNDYLDADIDAILQTGVQVQLDTQIGGEAFAAMRKQYDAIYLAIGAHGANNLGVEGDDAGNVLSAVALLRAMGDGKQPDFRGKRVVIVGGGNVAMDCTRTAMRLGASEVKCVYRRRQEDMTALREEVEGAIAEGCEMVTMMSPVRVEKDAQGNVAALIVQPQMPGAYDRGRPKPVKADKPCERIECDVLIAAIGQVVESEAFAAQGVPTRWNNITVGQDAAVFTEEAIFAGGDAASGPSTVIRAVEAGKTAAANIDAALGSVHQLPRTIQIPPANRPDCEPSGRINLQERSAQARKQDFVLMEQTMTKQEACQECSRCLRCDHYGFGAFRGGRDLPW